MAETPSPSIKAGNDPSNVLGDSKPRPSSKPSGPPNTVQDTHKEAFLSAMMDNLVFPDLHRSIEEARTAALHTPVQETPVEEPIFTSKQFQESKEDINKLLFGHALGSTLPGCNSPANPSRSRRSPTKSLSLPQNGFNSPQRTQRPS